MRTKAQIGLLQTIVLTLVIVGVIIGVGFLVLEEFQSTLSENVATVSTPENIAPTTTGIYVTNNYTTAGINCYNAFTITQVKNRTGDIVISAGNYSYNPATGLIQNISTYALSTGNLWNVTYTYQYGKEACSGVETTVAATAKIPTWLSIIVILAIVGILLAIVFKVLPSGGGGFSFGRGSGGTVAEI